MDSVYLPGDSVASTVGWDERGAIERAIADRAAFAPLYQRYARQVLQYLLTRCDSQDDAADLMQVVFLHAMESLPSLHGRHRGAFAAWLFRIARNTVIDARRRERPVIPWDHVPETLLLFPDPGSELAMVRRDTLNTLRMVIAELSPYTQELLALRFAAELSITEIATTTGKSEAAVRKQLVRTMHTLQERFNDYRL